MNIPESTLPAPLGFDDSSLRHDTLEKLLYGVGKDVDNATLHDLYSAVALAIRERLLGRWHETQRRIRRRRPRKVYYLSLEFLMGRTLLNAAINLELDKSARLLLEEIGVRLERLVEEEQDAGLGNGGLGRLAACFLDSMATLDLAGFGYGIRYDYGLFEQQIGPEGEQVERPNTWLRLRNLWEIKREDLRYQVRIGGSCRTVQDEDGTTRHRFAVDLTLRQFARSEQDDVTTQRAAWTYFNLDPEGLDSFRSVVSLGSSSEGFDESEYTFVAGNFDWKNRWDSGLLFNIGFGLEYRDYANDEPLSKDTPLGDTRVDTLWRFSAAPGWRFTDSISALFNYRYVTDISNKAPYVRQVYGLVVRGVF